MVSPRTWRGSRALPYKHIVDEGGVLLCHGSPVRLEEFEYIFAPEQARECLSIWELGHITLIGHSHLCKVFALTRDDVSRAPPADFDLEPDKKYIVSVGSVGQPRDFDNRASFTVFDTEKKRFEFKRVEYDIELAAEKVFAPASSATSRTASSSASDRSACPCRLRSRARVMSAIEPSSTTCARARPRACARKRKKA
jgi:diadenosine tetraphosphatase ApaH/serine/threonine PP2A family protein phosphatase